MCTFANSAGSSEAKPGSRRERGAALLNAVRSLAAYVWVSMLLGACATPVSLTYSQTGACNGYVSGNSTVSSGPNAAYVIFKIETIDNRQGSTDFSFDPKRLYIAQNGSVDLSLSVARDLSFAKITAASVPKGTIASPSAYGVVVVRTVDVNGAEEANRTNYFLNYATQPSDSGVLLTKTNASQSSWPDTSDCKSISF